MEQHAESPEEVERGLMAYFSGPDSVDRKVQSYYFTAEVRDGRLWGVAECKVRGALTPLELAALTDEIGGQASDGAEKALSKERFRWAMAWKSTPTCGKAKGGVS